MVDRRQMHELAEFHSSYRDALRKIDPELILNHYGARNLIDMPDSITHSCLIDTVTPHHTNGDESPSASISKKALGYHCWTYGGGDILWFIQEMEDCDRYEALDILADFIEDTDEPRETALETIQKVFSRGKESEAPIPSYNTIILEPWAMIHPYMLDRGFGEETLQRYMVGYDEKYHQIVLPHLSNGILVGYQKRRQDDSRWPTTPATDSNGIPIPKYKNSKDFPKDKTLFNLDQLLKREDNSAIIVESVMSVYKAETWYDQTEDFGNVIATFGSKVTQKQIDILKRFELVTLMMDNDPGGWHGTIALYDGLKDFCRVRIVEMPAFRDLADLRQPEAEMLRDLAKPGSLKINHYRNLMKGIKNGIQKVRN
jgi:DNA primase